MCHNWLRERLYEAEIVAPSSYQKDGRPAPARLTTEPNTATITGSSAARGGVRRSPRTFAIRRLESPLNTSPWCQSAMGTSRSVVLAAATPHRGSYPAEMLVDWVRVLS